MPRRRDAPPYLVAAGGSSDVGARGSPRRARYNPAAPLRSGRRPPGGSTMKLLQTTIAGSLPKPAWLATPRELWAPWRLEGEALAEGWRDAVRLAVRDQERAGIDIVSDGEQTRRHFVTTFIEGLEGVDFEHRRTVRIRDRYDADVPVVVGPVARRRPIYVEAARLLRGESERRTKFTLPGR